MRVVGRREEDDERFVFGQVRRQVVDRQLRLQHIAASDVNRSVNFQISEEAERDLRSLRATYEEAESHAADEALQDLWLPGARKLLVRHQRVVTSLDIDHRQRHARVTRYTEAT